jgi:hypothetical protein
MTRLEITTATALTAALLFAACSDDPSSGPHFGQGGAASGSSTASTATGATSSTGSGVTSTGAGGSSSSTTATTGSVGTTTSGAGGSAGSGMGGSGTGGTGVGGSGGGGPGSTVDPQCLDGKAYAAEPVPDRTINVDDLIASYSSTNLLPWTIQMLNRRYPIGAIGPSEAQRKNDLGCFNVAFNMPMPSVQTALDAMNTVVHECGHMLDLDGRWVIRADLEYKCNANLTQNTPARNIILKDEFDALGPKGGGLDFVKDIYLNGDSGKQDFRLLYTEYNQYVNQIGSAYAYYDKTKETSVAEGSRYFAWFVERYLRLLRASYATEYNKVAGDACWRQLILADWGRMYRRWDEVRKANMKEFVSAEVPKVDALVADPRLLAEIENLRVLDGCRK